MKRSCLFALSAIKNMTSNSGSTRLQQINQRMMATQIPKELFTKKNVSVILHGKEDLRIEESPLPEVLNFNGNFGNRFECFTYFLILQRFCSSLTVLAFAVPTSICGRVARWLTLCSPVPMHWVTSRRPWSWKLAPVWNTWRKEIELLLSQLFLVSNVTFVVLVGTICAQNPTVTHMACPTPMDL